ncbi:MAG TPA: papain-like cysteine protease family protein [Bryobacteraceae bacterium]|nr:papain-like cysteine protease family protein [Bryobacteraceae bacterium]
MKRTAPALAIFFAAGFAARAAGLWLDVPFVRQTENGCGAAALSMTIQYWSRAGAAVDLPSADAGRIQTELYSAGRHGILASAMKRYLEDHGFQTLVFRGQWDDLREQLGKGRPLIVALRSGGESHYVVLAGVDAEAVEMNDPADRKLRKMGRAEFERKWRAAGNWTLLPVPRAAS